MTELEVTPKRRKVDHDSGAQEKHTPSEMAPPWTYQNGLFNTVTVDGGVFVKFPVNIPMEQHVHNIRSMAMREDDIIVAAFPKSGSHWVWEMVQMLTQGKAEYDLRCKHHAMIEFNETADLDYLLAPRVLSSHLFLRQLSNQIATKRSRVVHVMRNPKDLVVSFYHHLKQMDKFEDRGFDAFALNFLHSGEAQGPYLDYFSYMQEMVRWQQQHPQVPVINIFYEDVKKNPVQCVRQLAQFLQCHVTDAVCTDIAEACSFHNLKVAHDTVKVKDRPGRHLFKNGRPQLFRTGEVGDWKNHFTMALSEQFDQVVSGRLRDCNIPFQYSI